MDLEDLFQSVDAEVMWCPFLWSTNKTSDIACSVFVDTMHEGTQAKKKEHKLFKGFYCNRINECC